MVGSVPQVKDPQALADQTPDELKRQKRLVSELAGIFNMLDRSITMLRVYPVGHPLVDTFCDQIAERMQTVLVTEEEFHVTLRANELLTDWGQSFFTQESSEREQFLWYMPFSDGVYGLCFHEGVSGDEIQSLMRVIDRVNQETVGLDDDTVTLLWDQDFDHITYYALDGFVDSVIAREFGGLSEPAARDVLIEAAIEPKNSKDRETLRSIFNTNAIDNLDTFTVLHIKSQAGGELQNFRKSDLAYAFKYEPSLGPKLYKQWSSGNDLEHRFIEALISIIRANPESESGRRAGNLIVEITLQLLDIESYGEALAIMEMLRDRRDVFEQTTVDPLKEIIAPLIEPLRLDALFNRMQKLHDQREKLASLLCFLEKDPVQKHALVILCDPKRELAALAAVVDVLYRVTEVENANQITAARYIEQPIYLKRIMPNLSEHDLINWPGTSAMLKAAVAHESYEVRLQALNVKHPLWQDERAAESYVAPLCSDDYEDVRRRALQVLGKSHAKLFREVIARVLKKGDVKGRTSGELRFLMRTYIQHEATALVLLRELVKPRGWFSATKAELARAAAVVVIGVKDLEGIALVKKRSESFLTRASLREEYKGLLRHIDPKLLGAAPAADKPADKPGEQPPGGSQ
ncbi:MAG: hypothetical protein H0U74_07270 [Bradymonadaceae bacterium]|nr:hypothetical protein [Lujinxingiaceae bacterium]